MTAAPVWKWILIAEKESALPYAKPRLPANVQTDILVQIVNNDRHVKAFVEEVSHTLAVRRISQGKLSLVAIQGGDAYT